LRDVLILPRAFYEKDPALVARNLLGKVLLRRTDSEVLTGKIVETEAYYGEEDPASRAFRGEKTYNKVMFGEPGRVFIYMVHSHWLLNIVAHPEGEVGAILMRALEPLEGIRIMSKNRGVEDVRALTSGPGKLTRALAVTNELNGKDVTEDGPIVVVEGEEDDFEVGISHRIGVRVDLPQELRFFIKGNKFLSR